MAQITLNYSVEWWNNGYWWKLSSCDLFAGSRSL